VSGFKGESAMTTRKRTYLLMFAVLAGSMPLAIWLGAAAANFVG
jgi:uncharacterized membrane protein